MNMSFSTRACVGWVLCLLMLAGAAWAEQDAPMPGPAAPQRPGMVPPFSSIPTGPTLQWLSVVLLSADMEAGADAADIPPAVQRALADVKDFLPFKSYRLHDAAIIGPGGGTVRLRGAAANAAFEASLGTPQRVSLDGGAGIGFRLPFELSEIAGGSTSSVLKTTVTLGVGETVVVGTSRVRGQGLIAFITAAASTQ